MRFAQYPIESIGSPFTRYGVISTVLASRPHRESDCSCASLGVVPIGRAIEAAGHHVLLIVAHRLPRASRLRPAACHPVCPRIRQSDGARNWHRWRRRPIAAALSRACAIRCVSHGAAQATARGREARTRIGRSRDPTEHSALRTHILRGFIGEMPSLVSDAPPRRSQQRKNARMILTPSERGSSFPSGGCGSIRARAVFVGVLWDIAIELRSRL